MDPQPENVVPNEFDPGEFWEQHKSKILLYGLLLLGGIVAFVIHQISTHRSLAESQALYQQAENAESYRRLIQEYPRSTAAANAHFLLAAELRREGKYDEALEILRELVGKFPEHPLVGGAWLSLGATQQAQGKPEDALATYQQIVARHPQSYAGAFAQFNSAELLRAQGRTEEARQAYETLISQFPESYLVRQAQQSLQFLK